MIISKVFKVVSQTICIVSVLACVYACSDSSDRRPAPQPQPIPQEPEAPPPPLQSLYELSSPDSVPEGVAFDEQDRAFYATSLQGGGITRIDADGTESDFRKADSRAQLLGVKVDAEARRLWVCARAVDGVDSRVWVFDLASGEQVMEFLLGALATNGACNDLALDGAGVAYVTDSSSPNIYRLDPASEQGSIFISDPLLADVFGIGLGLNGIVVSEDNNSLIVGTFLPTQLISIALSEGRELSVLTLEGDTLPPPDGLVMLGDILFSVSDSAVSKITLNENLTMGTVINSAYAGGLSTATVAEGEVYVIKSEVKNFVLNQALNTPFEIFKVDQSAFE